MWAETEHVTKNVVVVYFQTAFLGNIQAAKSLVFLPVIRENRLGPPKNLRMFAGFENESFLFRLKFGPLKLKAEMG